MPTTKQHQPQASQSETSVLVSDAAAAKVLDEILRKPNQKRRVTPAKVQNKRKMIGAGVAKPSEAIVALLRDNGRLEEYVAALRVLLNPGEVTYSLTDVARRVTSAGREIGESVEDLLMGRADSHDYSVLRDGGRMLAEDCSDLSQLAARAQYTPQLRRTA